MNANANGFAALAATLQRLLLELLYRLDPRYRRCHLTLIPLYGTLILVDTSREKALLSLCQEKLFRVGVFPRIPLLSTMHGSA